MFLKRKGDFVMMASGIPHNAAVAGSTAKGTGPKVVTRDGMEVIVASRLVTERREYLVPVVRVDRKAFDAIVRLRTRVHKSTRNENWFGLLIGILSVPIVFVLLRSLSCAEMCAEKEWGTLMAASLFAGLLGVGGVFSSYILPRYFSKKAIRARDNWYEVCGLDPDGDIPYGHGTAYAKRVILPKD